MSAADLLSYMVTAPFLPVGLCTSEHATSLRHTQGNPTVADIDMHQLVVLHAKHALICSLVP